MDKRGWSCICVDARLFLILHRPLLYFIPYKQDAEGTIVNDEYFGKIPADRLIKENGIIYFKIDGLYRSKLGLPASRATDILRKL